MEKTEKISIVQKEIASNIINSVLSGDLQYKTQVSDLCLQPVLSQVGHKRYRIFNACVLSQMTINSYYQAIDWMEEKGLIEKSGSACDSYKMTSSMWKDVVLSYVRITLNQDQQITFVNNFKSLK